jgi:hypothetical protein
MSKHKHTVLDFDGNVTGLALPAATSSSDKEAIIITGEAGTYTTDHTFLENESLISADLNITVGFDAGTLAMILDCAVPETLIATTDIDITKVGIHPFVFSKKLTAAEVGQIKVVTTDCTSGAANIIINYDSIPEDYTFVVPPPTWFDLFPVGGINPRYTLSPGGGSIALGPTGGLLLTNPAAVEAEFGPGGGGVTDNMPRIQFDPGGGDFNVRMYMESVGAMQEAMDLRLDYAAPNPTLPDYVLITEQVRQDWDPWGIGTMGSMSADWGISGWQGPYNWTNNASDGVWAMLKRRGATLSSYICYSAFGTPPSMGSFTLMNTWYGVITTGAVISVGCGVVWVDPAANQAKLRYLDFLSL